MAVPRRLWRAKQSAPVGSVRWRRWMPVWSPLTHHGRQCYREHRSKSPNSRQDARQGGCILGTHRRTPPIKPTRTWLCSEWL